MSEHRCQSLEPSEWEELSTRIPQATEVKAWFGRVLPLYARLSPSYRLITVVVSIDSTGKPQTVETCLFWQYAPAIELELTDGRSYIGHAVWSVVEWHLPSGFYEQGGRRSYESGRAVELIYHTFNEANAREGATAVLWLGVSPNSSLQRVINRAEFDVRLDSTTWVRPVRPL